MNKKKYARRVRDYVRRGDVKKLRAYVRKQNQLKLTNCYLDSKKRTALHLAVKYKRKEMLTYLLKHGFDNLIEDEKGNVPLMTAIRLALKSKKRGKRSKLKVYVDFVLPLLHACPEAMKVSNKKGVCGRRLVQKLVGQLNSVKDHETMKAENPKIYSAMFDSGWMYGSPSSIDTEHSGIDCDDRNTEEDDGDIAESIYSNWEEKIGEEAESEYFQTWGQYEHDFSHSCATDYETYSDWGDRMYHEHYARQAAERERIYGRRHHGTSANREGRQYSEKIKKPVTLSEEELADRARRMEKLRLAKKHRDYVIRCQRLFGDSSPSGGTITIDDMPHVDGKFIDMLLVEQRENLNSESLRQFFRKQQIQWHPDKFMQKCGNRLNPTDKEEIMERVKEISQAINSYGETLYGS